MDILKFCRVCLEMDITLYNLHSNSLEHYYQLLTGTNPLHQLKQPMFACYECAALLRKFFMFRQKSIRAQAVIQGILLRSGQITEEDVKDVDKQYFFLSTSLKLAMNIIDINIYPATDGNDSKNKLNSNTTKSGGKKKYIIKESTVNDSGISTMNSEISISPTMMKDVASCAYRKGEPPSSPLQQEDSASIQIYISPVADDDTLYESDNLSDKNVKIGVCDKELNRNELPVDYENKRDCVEVINVKKKNKAKNATKSIEKSCDLSVNMVKAFRKDSDLEEFVHIVHLSKEEQLEKIRLRKESAQYINATYKCDKCFLWFIDKRAQDKHGRLHGESRGSLACDVCRVRYNTPLQLKLHYSSHPKRYICRTCRQVFGTFYQARLHVLYHQGLRYKCPHCDEIYSNRSAFLNHERSGHRADFTCCFCGNSFDSQFGLDVHKTLEHKDLNVNEISASPDCPDCAECGVRFATVGAFRRHLLTARRHGHAADKFSCNECDEKFPTITKLKKHRQAEHPRAKRYKRTVAKESKTWPVKCPHCSLEIASPMENWWHYKRIHPDKNYPAKKRHICEVCGKFFVSKTVLDYHMNVHTQSRPFTCETCGAAFRNRGGLRAHRSGVHAAARPFACADCGRAFKAKGTLAKHTRIHTGEKPYKCDICEKAFAFNTSRKLHYRRMHLRLPDPYKEARRQRKLAKALAKRKT